MPSTTATDSANMWYGFYAYQKKMAEDNNYTSVKSHMIWEVIMMQCKMGTNRG